MPKVSLIVPVYKVENYINQCLDSLINQTLKDIEIILIDDGSPDNSGKICDEYSRNDHRIKVIHKENGGVSAARNDGIKEATGDYIMFLDSDDWAEENMCEVAYNAIVEKKVDMAFFTHYTNYSNKEILENKMPKSFYYDKKEDIEKIQLIVINDKYVKLIDNSLSYSGFTAPWSKIFSRKFIQENNILYNLNVKGIFDDGLFVLECLEKANNIYFENVSLYHYRIIDSSIMRSYNPNKIQIYNTIFDELKLFANKYKKSDMFFEVCCSRAVINLTIVLDICFFNKLNKTPYKEKSQQIKKLLNSKDYSEAIQKTNSKFLSKKQKVYFKLFEKNNVFLMYLFTNVVRIIKKIIKK